MDKLNVKCVGNDCFLLDMIELYLKRYNYLDVNARIQRDLFLKASVPQKVQLVIYTLPSDRSQIYALGLQSLKIFPSAKTIAIGHRPDIADKLGLQHFDKMFHYYLDRSKSADILDQLALEIKNAYNIKESHLPFIRMTPREKQIVNLTCQEFDNTEIAHSLNISVRTVETHKSNIYSKLGSNHPSRLFRYASIYGIYNESLSKEQIIS